MKIRHDKSDFCKIVVSKLIKWLYRIHLLAFCVKNATTFPCLTNYDFLSSDKLSKTLVARSLAENGF